MRLTVISLAFIAIVSLIRTENATIYVVLFALIFYEGNNVILIIKYGKIKPKKISPFVS